MANLAQKIIQDANIVESKSQSDTIRLWESYQEQATLWRSIALLQIPGVILALLMCMWLYATQKTVVNVPHKPAPGLYHPNEIPEVEFIDTATNFVNLIATYQPVVARRQYLEAQKMVIEPMLTTFNQEMLGTELKTIERTSRTQIFFIDPTKTEVIRERQQIKVQLVGERMKIIAGRQLAPIPTAFTITMGVIPRNKLNPYGIMVTDVKVERMKKL